MSPRPAEQVKIRLLLLSFLVFLLPLLLIFRLWQVQLRQTDAYRQRISRQSIRRIRLPPVRGRIFTADGTMLVDNRPSRDLVFYPAEMRRRTVKYIYEQIENAGLLIGREERISEARIGHHLYYYPALPLTVFQDLDDRELALIAEQPEATSGREIRVRPVRYYPYPGLATHILGFSGRRLPLDDFELRKYSYVDRELRGREGIERQYDEELSGQGGERLVRVDNLGYVHREIGTPKLPRDGYEVVLNIETRAQMAAESALTGVVGAVVILHVNSGAVVALASSPSYNLAELSASRYSELRNDNLGRPLSNRAIQAGYTPGSIVKPLIALAALANGKIRVDTVLHCNGAWRIGQSGRIRCWHRAGHGDLDLLHALEQSCNPYFIEAGVATGLDRIRPVFTAAGLGSRPRIDLAGAGAGLSPSRGWARNTWKRDWITIDTAFLSIGQGAVTLSPLQAAGFTAAIANGGTLYRPYLLHSLRDPQGGILQIVPAQPVSRIEAAPDDFAAVRHGMWLAVNGENATAAQVRNPFISVAGKTGTAEVIQAGERAKIAWFVCFAPVEDPLYAMAVMVEDGVSGGQTAVPLAARIFEQWLGSALRAE